MKVGTRPQSFTDLVAIASGAVPQPVFDTLLAAGLARTIMVATKHGVFEALSEGPLTSAELAARCSTAPEPTSALMHALTASGYVHERGDTYSLTSMARKWMLESSEQSLTDHMALMYVVWRWLEHYETFLSTGQPLDVHETLTEGDWELYQRGMKSLASLCIDEFLLRTPIPKDPQNLIDVGGAHGAYSAALCKRHSTLRAEILDLPLATEKSKALIEEHGLGARLVQRPGDARTFDYGQERYDIILVSNLCHHFDEPTNTDLVHRLAAALRPRGVLVIQEPFRSMVARNDQTGALGAFYFAMLSESRTWTTDDVTRWYAEARLLPKRPTKFLTVPGFGQVIARKPG